MKFALNHSVAPQLSIPQFLDLAGAVEVEAVELRTNLPPGWSFPTSANVATYAPDRVAFLARDAGITILSINALLRFDLWDQGREREARALVDFAQAAGIGAVVMCPSVAAAGSPPEQSRLEEALDGLIPILDGSGVRGLIEPLGFPGSSIRLKADVDAALIARGAPSCLGIVHDSFHHAVAQEQHLSSFTGLVHLSGVPDIGLPRDRWGDEHRILVDQGDVMDNVGQVRQLRESYDGYFSFEPFAVEVSRSPTLADDLAQSITFLSSAAGRDTSR